MTPMPRTKLASLPSLRLLAPSARPSSANTKHATGMENFLWISMTGLWVETPGRLEFPDALRAAPRPISSRSPRAGPVRGKTLSGSSETTICWNLSTS